MLEETHKVRLTPAARFWCILLILGGIAVIGGVGSWLNRALNTAAFDYVTLAVLAFSAWGVYRWMILEYRYRLEGKTLYIDVLSGRRVKTVQTVDMDSLLSAGAPGGFLLWGRYYVLKDTGTRTELAFLREGKTKRIRISPEDTLLHSLTESIHSRTEREA